VEITSATLATVRPSADSATHELRVTVANTGMLPTALEQAKRIKIVQPDRLQILSPQQSGMRVLTQIPTFFLGGNERREFVIRVQATGAAGAARQPITLRASSTRGGVVQRVVNWQ
jgi:3-oxoacyl-[acyl-carrier-protein] synthase III